MNKFMRFSVTLLIALPCFFLSSNSALAAATATIGVSPTSGNYKVGQSFNVDILVTGNGQQLTTFGADVALTNLTLLEITKGTTVSNWTTEPKVTAPSFYGGVTGQVSSITAYTMKVQPKAAGEAKITLSNGSVLSTDGFNYTEILSSVSGATYTIGAASSNTVTTPVAGPQKTLLPDEGPFSPKGIINILLLQAVAFVIYLIYLLAANSRKRENF